ncbi:hypothetical protein MBRA1_003046 [Malassezia brasiliensis]|uniref:EamA domain-containing protein n=1 Tax=Malassezia brasiliensis TaxID=1821822 RepID=A0AAF0IPM2_9BASI|nr:hypothetical protein MBRA1_003046 [Malassezia brasiliensis]
MARGMSARTGLLVLGMLITGILNSLVSKWQDMQCVENCEPDSPDKPVLYSQPVWQTLQMFVGEMSCLVPFFAHVVRKKWRRWQRERARQAGGENQSLISVNDESEVAPYGSVHASFLRVNVPNLFGGLLPVDGDGMTAVHVRRRLNKWWNLAVMFVVPALCDICATTLMNSALIIMPVSIFQMTRGALVLWVGLFSVMFLHHRLRLYEWVSLVLVMLGVAIVGLSSVLVNPTASVVLMAARAADAQAAIDALLGLAMVLSAQIFAALQFVYEEKVMGDHEVEPMLAVGLEGLFGSLLVLTMMPFLHYFIGSTPAGHGGYFDMVTGWHQLVGVPRVLWGSLLCATSIALYNMFGLSVTRLVSATARSTIDTFRTLGITFVSIALGWEVLQPLSGLMQALGFTSLAYGTFVFNGVVAPPRLLLTRRERAELA